MAKLASLVAVAAFLIGLCLGSGLAHRYAPPSWAIRSGPDGSIIIPRGSGCIIIDRGEVTVSDN